MYCNTSNSSACLIAEVKTAHAKAGAVSVGRVSGGSCNPIYGQFQPIPRRLNDRSKAFHRAFVKSPGESSLLVSEAIFRRETLELGHKGWTLANGCMRNVHSMARMHVVTITIFTNDYSQYYRI